MAFAVASVMPSSEGDVSTTGAEAAALPLASLSTMNFPIEPETRLTLVTRKAHMSVMRVPNVVSERFSALQTDVAIAEESTLTAGGC
jgi:hypothetical protein